MPHSVIPPHLRRPARALRDLTICNPFLPRRIELERELLGDEYEPGGEVWSISASAYQANPNIPALGRRAVAIVTELLPHFEGDAPISDDDLDVLEDAATYVLYDLIDDELHTEILAPPPKTGTVRPLRSWGAFRREAARLLGPVRRRRPTDDDATLVAWLWQVRRAFHFVFTEIFGASMPAARLRAAAWQSVFTHDVGRYRRGLFRRMHEIPTLVTGPSGTGKDLVARAIGSSSFIAFDAETGRFVEDFRRAFLPLNLSALSPTLIESELFGHCKGAFTGAIQTRQGYLEERTPSHAVFLDEIGELDPAIQVKLLQVLQTRQFRRIGETRERRFDGRIIAATNRNLDAEVADGRFRADLYYRLCADRIETPSLAELIAEDPDELVRIVRLLSRRLVGERDDVAEQVVAWIRRELGPDYAWPGNVRELEQCVRNIIVRGSYRPLAAARASRPAAPLDALLDDVRAGRLSADELIDRYATIVYAQTGSYVAAAERLGLDRRTVKRRIVRELLDELATSDDAAGGRSEAGSS
jgi:transcriptional regulator with AAA-type ATPase domain